MIYIKNQCLISINEYRTSKQIDYDKPEVGLISNLTINVAMHVIHPHIWSFLVLGFFNTPLFVIYNIFGAKKEKDLKNFF